MAMKGSKILGVSQVSRSPTDSYRLTSQQIKDVIFRPGSTFEEGTIMLTSVDKGGREVQLGEQ